MKIRGTLRVGHRGAAGYEPENTIASLERAIALDVDFVEVDIQKTLDGQLVLMHDKFVDRTTNGIGRLSEMRWEDLRALDAGSGQRVPSLEEFLEAANGRTSVILESITSGIGIEVYGKVQTMAFRGRVIFSSFLHDNILAIRKADSRALTMALLEGVPIARTSFAQDAGATHVGVSLDSMTREFGESLHQAGIDVFVYTADTAEQISLAKELGADGIISNFPDRI